MCEFKTRAHGIPCIVRVVDYEPATPGHFRGHPDRWEPADPSEIVLEILDSRGKPAAWLERKLDAREWSRLEQEAVQHLEEVDA
jgi:hypothetical protein